MGREADDEVRTGVGPEQRYSRTSTGVSAPHPRTPRNIGDEVPLSAAARIVNPLLSTHGGRVPVPAPARVACFFFSGGVGGDKHMAGLRFARKACAVVAMFQLRLGLGVRWRRVRARACGGGGRRCRHGICMILQTERWRVRMMGGGWRAMAV